MIHPPVPGTSFLPFSPYSLQGLCRGAEASAIIHQVFPQVHLPFDPPAAPHPLPGSGVLLLHLLQREDIPVNAVHLRAMRADEAHPEAGRRHRQGE